MRINRNIHALVFLLFLSLVGLFDKINLPDLWCLFVAFLLTPNEFKEKQNKKHEDIYVLIAGVLLITLYELLARLTGLPQLTFRAVMISFLASTVHMLVEAASKSRSWLSKVTEFANSLLQTPIVVLTTSVGSATIAQFLSPFLFPSFEEQTWRLLFMATLLFLGTVALASKTKSNKENFA